MKNSKILKMIGLFIAAVGAIISAVGVYLQHEAETMLSALNAGSSLFGYSSSTYHSMSVWDEHLHKGNIVLIIGIILVVVGVAAFTVGYLKGNKANHPKQMLSAPPANGEDAASIAERINKLDELKEHGILSEEEYNTKRQEITDRL